MDLLVKTAPIESLTKAEPAPYFVRDFGKLVTVGSWLAQRGLIEYTATITGQQRHTVISGRSGPRADPVTG